MSNAQQMRELALALPEVEEKSHFGQPDFRISNKIFADISRDGSVATVKLTTELQFALTQDRPATFYPAPSGWGRSGWTHVVLNDVGNDELRQLLQEGYRLISPHNAARATKKAASAAKAPDRERPKKAHPATARARSK
jgi:hypothetical protein